MTCLLEGQGWSPPLEIACNIFLILQTNQRFQTSNRHVS
jgi:hypothetical protein